MLATVTFHMLNIKVLFSVNETNNIYINWLSSWDAKLGSYQQFEVPYTR